MGRTMMNISLSSAVIFGNNRSLSHNTITVIPQILMKRLNIPLLLVLKWHFRISNGGSTVNL